MKQVEPSSGQLIVRQVNTQTRTTGPLGIEVVVGRKLRQHSQRDTTRQPSAKAYSHYRDGSPSSRTCLCLGCTMSSVHSL